MATERPFVEDMSMRGFGAQDVPVSHWTLRWNRVTKTLSVKFEESWWNAQPDRDTLVVLSGGEVSTKMEADIRYMQGRLAEVARKGDLT